MSRKDLVTEMDSVCQDTLRKVLVIPVGPTIYDIDAAYKESQTLLTPCFSGR
jgi:hypothetical protein